MSEVTANGCKLKWEKPEDDGGKPITAYQVEKLDTQTGRWVPIGRTTDTDMDVKGLQEGHAYQFRVKAINDEGESEPLETEGATTAKNPYGEYSVLKLFITKYRILRGRELFIDVLVHRNSRSHHCIRPFSDFIDKVHDFRNKKNLCSGVVELLVGLSYFLTLKGRSLPNGGKKDRKREKSD